MTLDWEKTASDRQVVEHLAPLIQGRFRHTGARWHVRTGDDTWTLDRHDLNETLRAAAFRLPETKHWDRTRRRLFTEHGLYQIKRLLAEVCRHP